MLTISTVLIKDAGSALGMMVIIVLKCLNSFSFLFCFSSLIDYFILVLVSLTNASVALVFLLVLKIGQFLV